MKINTAKITVLPVVIFMNSLSVWAMQPSTYSVDEVVELLIEEEEKESDEEEKEQDETAEERQEDHEQEHDEKSDEENLRDRYLANLDTAKRLVRKVLPSSCCGCACCIMTSVLFILTFIDEIFPQTTKEELMQMLLSDNNNQIGYGDPPP
ncbi:MAG: hypothetical protein AAF310_02765 [Myxococcota bacterium]